MTATEVFVIVMCVATLAFLLDTERMRRRLRRMQLKRRAQENLQRQMTGNWNSTGEQDNG